MVRSVFEMISKMGFVQFECTMHNAHCIVAIGMLSEVSNIIEIVAKMSANISAITLNIVFDKLIESMKLKIAPHQMFAERIPKVFYLFFPIPFPFSLFIHLLAFEKLSWEMSMISCAHIWQESDHDKQQIWKVPTLIFWQNHTNHAILYIITLSSFSSTAKTTRGKYWTEIKRSRREDPNLSAHKEITLVPDLVLSSTILTKSRCVWNYFKCCDTEWGSNGEQQK